MSAHTTWREAHDIAQERADQSQRDIGVRRMREYGRDVFIVAALPAPAFRFGEDLRAEVIAPAQRAERC